jgi:hypothetical protein
MSLFAAASRGAQSFGAVAGQQRATFAFAMSGAEQRMMSSVADRDNILPVSPTRRLGIILFPVDRDNAPLFMKACLFCG